MKRRNQPDVKTLKRKEEQEEEINNQRTIVNGNTNGCTSKANCAESAQCIYPSQ